MSSCHSFVHNRDNIRLDLLEIGNVSMNYPSVIVLIPNDGSDDVYYAEGKAILVVENKGANDSNMLNFFSRSWSIVFRHENGREIRQNIWPNEYRYLPSFPEPQMRIPGKQMAAFIVGFKGGSPINHQWMKVDDNDIVCEFHIEYKENQKILKSNKISFLCKENHLE